MIDAEALTIPEACAASRIGRTKIYQAIKEGRLVARKLGKKTLILPSDLRDYLSSLPLMGRGQRRRDRRRDASSIFPDVGVGLSGMRHGFSRRSD